MSKKLYRTTGPKAMILGVCGGLADYFEVDPTIIRVAFALLSVVGVGSPIIAYIILAFIVPKEETIN